MSSATKTLDDFLVEVSVLNAEILNSELITRGIAPARGPLINKRRQLASALLKESEGQIFVPYFEFEPIVDLRKCAALVTVFEVELNRAGSSYEDKQKAIGNLKVLDARINRIICTNNDEKTLARGLSHNVKRLILPNVTENVHSNDNCQLLDLPTDQPNIPNDAHVEQHHVPLTSTPDSRNINQPQPVRQIHTNQNDFNFNPYELENAMANFHLQSPSYDYSNGHTFRPNKLPVHKWKIRFSGTNDKQDAFEFLRIVKSKARSYQTTQEELFASASEFFTGDASKWYFSQDFSDWSDLETKLLADFMQVNYFDDLIDIIRQRKQTSNETVVQFFTIFEDNCSRLLSPLTTVEKINILKRNVLQKYQSYIALMQFHSINDMKHALKVLEATMSQNYYGNNRNVRFDSRDRQSLSRERYSHSPNRSNSNERSNHVSRYEKFDSKNQDFRSVRDRTRSPYPVSNNQRTFDGNKQRERSNSNSNQNRSRDNSRENSFFRPSSRENSVNRK